MKKGKTILIIGGTDGLGKALAKQLQGNNTVIVASSNKDRVLSVSKEYGCDGVVCDVTDVNSIQSCIGYVEKKYSKIDSIIYCSGLWIQGALSVNTPGDIQHVVDVNLTGALLLFQRVIPIMEKQGKGEILVVISQAGLYGKAERSVYNATKFGLTGLVKSLSMELAGKGIKVIGLYPGMMKTSMFEKVGIQKDMEKAIDPEVVAKSVDFILSLPDTVVVPEMGIRHILG